MPSSLLSLSVPLTIGLGLGPVLNPYGSITVNGTLLPGDGSSPANQLVTFTDNGIALSTAPVLTDALGNFSVVLGLGNVNNTLVASTTNSSGTTTTSAPVAVNSHKDATLFGNVVTDANTVGGQVFALYRAVLGREPDPLGFENTVNAVNAGTSLAAVAQGMLSSPEYTGQYGAVTVRSQNDVLTTLYQNALGRNPDLVGQLGFTAALATGTTEASVAQTIAVSSESLGRVQATFNTTGGTFVPDVTDSNVARLYYGLLNRAPDATGLLGFETAARQGTSLDAIANIFLGSNEFQAASGNLTNTQFVQSLYAGALGRTTDAGAQGWVTALNAGATRSSIALGISESQEAMIHLAANVEIGNRLQ